MAINFSAQFIVNEKTSTRVLRLTDTSTGFTLSKGNFIITFPDGTQVANTDFANPQITAPGGNASISLITDVDNTVLTGTYVITYVALNTSLNEFTKTETFDFNWEKPAKAIINDSDVVLPEVQFKDLTAYETSGSFAGTLTRNFYTTTPSTSEVGVITKTSVGDILTPVNASKYYEGVYLVKSDISVAYTHTSKSWLTIAYTDLLEETFDVREAPTQDELVALMNTYKDQIEAYKSTNPSQYEIMNEQYDLVLALYSHILARYQTNTLDGSKAILDQLLGLLPPTNPYTYKATQMLPFTINFSTSLTGTGTTGTLPKFTGTTTLGDSIIRESGGMIGIAKAPTAVLDVSGTIKGTSIVKDGGTSTQFLKADGSVDANSYQPLDGDLTAIAALAGTSGLVRKTAANTYELDSSAYLTGINSSQITTALGYTPENAANKGVNNGYAGLDGSGKVPSTQLPSYVDDVLEYANLASLPVTGETGKIYVALDTNKIYRWTGSVYVEISPTVGVVWGVISGTLANQTDLQAALNAKQATLTLTTTGTGGPATLLGATLNIPQYEGGYSSQLKHQVKLGATIAKGKAVYVSSADGTNMIVSVASNASESTSSKTLGLLETGGVTNDIVNVITEGLLAGLDTSTAIAGDPVWLGTNGNLIFGLLNKPFAPAHLVFIGIVTRVQQNNGEIFVKVQNGFELNEIHDVQVGSYGTKDVLYRDTTTNLWKNASIASVLGYTPANDSAVVKLTGDQTVAGVKTFTSPLLSNSPSGGATGEGLIVGQSFKIDGSGSSQAAVMYMVSNALSDTYGSGLTVQFANLAGDKAAGFNLNTAGGFELYVKNAIFGKALAITNTMAATFGSSVTATSFIKTGGISAEFLKADGSIDSNTYATTTQLALKADIANPVFTDNIYISGTNPRLYFTDTDSNPDYTIFTDSGNFYILNQTSGAYKFLIQETGNISAGVGNSMIATSFIKRGGTSEQFLMADGSVSEGESFVYPEIGIAYSGGSGWLTSIPDNSSNWNAAYSARISSLTTTGNSGAATLASNVLNIPNYTIAGLGGQPAFPSGDGFIKISGTTISYDNSTYYLASNPSNFITSAALAPYLLLSGGTLTGALGGTSASFSSSVTATSFVRVNGSSAAFLKADGSIDLRSFVTEGALENYLPLSGGSLTNSLSSGYVLSVTNTTEAAGANGLYVNIASGSTGTPFRVDRGGVSLISVNYLGATLLKSTITANQFIKANGTSSEFLMADGSVSTGTSFTYPSAGIVTSTGSAWGTSITDNSSNWNTAYSSRITSATAPLNITGTTISISQAGASANGFLSSTDWNTFNNKASTASLGNYLPLSGGTLTGNLQAPRFYNTFVNASSNSRNSFQSFNLNEATITPGWIAADFGDTGTTSNRVVLGSGYGNKAIIGAHSGVLDAWASLLINPGGGNVGIGTTATGFNAAGLPLVVGSGSGNTGMTIFSGASSSGSIHFADAETTGNASYSGYINYDHSGNSMQFGTTNTERMRITSGGDIQLNQTVSIIKTSENNSILVLVANPTLVDGESRIELAGRNFSGTPNQIAYRAATHIFTDSIAATERMRITSGGNVLIGTTTEAGGYRLQVNGLARIVNTNTAINYGELDSNNVYFQALNPANNTAKGITFYGTSEYMRITSGGNVLIGTTSDSGYKLQVNGQMSIDTGSFKGILGSISSSWGGSTMYPTLYGTEASRWVMHINPHISYTQNGVNGFTGSMTGATVRFASDAAATTFWDIGVGVCSIGTNQFGIGRGGLILFRIANTNAATFASSVTATSFFESSDNRLKTLIEDNYEAKGVESITAKLYTKNGVTELGYYAQDVQGILPSAVTTGENGFLNLSYREVHTAKIARLEKEVEELKAQLNLN